MVYRNVPVSPTGNLDKGFLKLMNRGSGVDRLCTLQYLPIHSIRSRINNELTLCTHALLQTQVFSIGNFQFSVIILRG